MDNDLLKEVLRRRRAKNFDVKAFLKDDSTKGLDSSDLDQNTEVVIGKGPSDGVVSSGQQKSQHSTDELAPSRSEMSKQGVEGAKENKMPKLFEGKRKEDFGQVSSEGVEEDISEVSGSDDLGVFDEREYERAKSKKRKTLTDRMYLGVGKKLGK